jgi:hypothetical protein
MTESLQQTHGDYWKWDLSILGWIKSYQNQSKPMSYIELPYLWGMNIHFFNPAILIVVQAGGGSSAASEFTGVDHSRSLGAGRLPKVRDPQNHGLH